MDGLETDLFLSHRVTLKKRYNLLLTQQTGTSHISSQNFPLPEVLETDILSFRDPR